MKYKAHTRYTLKDGTVVPGATTVLGELNKPALVVWANRLGLQGIDSTRYRDEMAEVGTLAHYLILCHFRNEKPDLGDYTANQIDAAENALIKYYDWEKAHIIEPKIIEQPLISEVYKFGGTADFIGLIDGAPGLLDFKTGSGIYEEMFYQLGAYNILLQEAGHKVENFRILRIGRDDKEGFEERVIHNVDLQTEVFKHCLSIYWLKKEIKGGK